ncbi:hypothetical protein ACIQCG_09130 [Streptomyces noursei]|uniref:hypothetical protein n=1 Tax=Streptomyces noursei TaxID=1971 RepID=UPI003826567E
MTTAEGDPEGRGLLVQVYEICPLCEFLNVPSREYTKLEAATSRLCPTRCGATLDVVIAQARQATSETDRLVVAFHDVLAGTDWPPSADDLALLVNDFEPGERLWNSTAEGPHPTDADSAEGA